MTDGLKDAHREAIIAVIAANDRVERAVLFGSRATGTNTVTSDVDIALFGDRLTLTHRARLTAALEEIPMAQTVDLLLYDSIQDRTLREHIRSHGVEWFARPDRDGGHETFSKSLGPANGGWSRVPLGSFVTLQRGHDLPTAVRRPGNTPILGSFGVTGWHDESRAAGPGVTVGRSGASFGVVTYSPVDYWPLNTALYVTDFHGNDPRFAYYFLKHFDFRSYNSGSAQPSLNRNFIHPIPIDVPPVAEQHSIVHILGTLDDKIELNRRMNETLEAMARALFKSWFLDFDPVRAKMEGRDTGLPQDIANLFPDRLVDSEMGEVPEGWEAKSLKDCMNLTMGQSPPGSTYNDHGDGLPFFQGRSEFGFRYPRKRRFCSAPTRVADPEDTLVTVRAPVGDINLAWERCCIGRGVAALRHKSGSSSFTYHSAWALRRELKEYEHTGTVFGAINKGQFEALRVTEPDPCVVEAFDAMAASLDARIRSNVAESDTLAALRDTLLPNLISVSGKIQLGTATRIIGMTA